MYQLFIPTGISVMDSLLRQAESFFPAEVKSWKRAWAKCLNETAREFDEKLLKAASQRILQAWYRAESTDDSKSPISQCCAELQSALEIIEIPEWYQRKVVVHLIRTESTSARVAVEPLTWLFSDLLYTHNIEVAVIPIVGIPGSQSTPDQGLQELIAYIHQQTHRVYRYNGVQHTLPAVINITSGFKSFTPVLTIAGQLLQLPLYYLYERTNELISIPPLPLSFDWSRLEIYRYWLTAIQQNPVDHNDHLNTSLDQQLVLNAAGRKIIENDLVPNQIVRWSKDKKRLELTFLGQLLDRYIRDQYPFGKRTMGLALEFLFYEHYINEPLQWNDQTFNWVNRQFTVNGRTFDLQFGNDRNRTAPQVLGEICSYGQIHPTTAASERPRYLFLPQLRKQLQALDGCQREVHGYLLLLYRYEGMGSWQNLYPALDDIAQKIDNLGIPHFQVVGVTLPLQHNGPKQQSPYSTLYHKKITRDKDNWRKGEKAQYGNPFILLEVVYTN